MAGARNPNAEYAADAKNVGAAVPAVTALEEEGDDEEEEDERGEDEGAEEGEAGRTDVAAAVAALLRNAA